MGIERPYTDETAALAAAVQAGAITDSVTKAPTHDAVFDALALKLSFAGGTMTGRIFKPATTDLGTKGAEAVAMDTVTYKGDFKVALSGTPTITLRDPGGECAIQVTMTAAGGPWTPIWTGSATYGPADIDWVGAEVPVVNANKIIVTLKREDAANKWAGEWGEFA